MSGKHISPAVSPRPHRVHQQSANRNLRLAKGVGLTSGESALSKSQWNSWKSAECRGVVLLSVHGRRCHIVTAVVLKLPLVPLLVAAAAAAVAVLFSRTQHRRCRLKGSSPVVLNHHDPVVIQPRTCAAEIGLATRPTNRRFHNNTDKGGCRLGTAVKLQQKPCVGIRPCGESDSKSALRLTGDSLVFGV